MFAFAISGMSLGRVVLARLSEVLLIMTKESGMVSGNKNGSEFAADQPGNSVCNEQQKEFEKEDQNMQEIRRGGIMMAKVRDYQCQQNDA